MRQQYRCRGLKIFKSALNNCFIIAFYDLAFPFYPLVKGNILYICINVTGKSMRKKLLWLFCIVVLSYVTAAAAGKAEITFENRYTTLAG